MPNPPGIGGPRGTVASSTVRPQAETPAAPQTTAPAAGAWSATGAQERQRTTGGQPAPVTTQQGPVDDQTRNLVRSTFEQLKGAQAELGRLGPQLQQAQNQLAADKKA